MFEVMVMMFKVMVMTMMVMVMVMVMAVAVMMVMVLMQWCYQVLAQSVLLYGPDRDSASYLQGC